MPIPDFQSLMLPVLRSLADVTDLHVRDIRARVAAELRLGDDDLRQLVPSGGATKFGDRISWALTYLTHAELIERPRRAVYTLASEGRALVASPPERVDVKFLKGYPAFATWQKRIKPSETDSEQTESTQTPEEVIRSAVEELTGALEDEVLRRLRRSSPGFFEQVVVKLLLAMDYGGGDVDMGSVTGKSGDGGIDGKIKEDKLGLDQVYIQAKKYGVSNKVGSGDVRNFIGAMATSRAQKGVFVTTADFSPAAKTAADRSPHRIVLISGEELASLMVEYDVGVRVRDPHRPPIQIKAIDEDFFQ